MAFPLIGRSRRTIYEYHRVEVDPKTIREGTVVILHPKTSKYKLLTLSPLQTALVQSKQMNGRIHCSYSVVKGLITQDTGS